MIALAVAALALLRQNPTTQGDMIKELKLTRPGATVPVALLRDRVDPLDPPHESPKSFGIPPKHWLFDWASTVLVQLPKSQDYALRFRVYAQERKAKNDLAPRVARMLATLWGEVSDRLNYDHSIRYNGKVVDAYLCWGGPAGGEQLFDVATETDGVRTVRKSVNTIYIYDVNSFSDPMEMAREVAHEYGHAIIPAIGGYTAPEGWANGFLGEKLFLYWLRDGMAEGRLNADDTLGASLEMIDGWLAKKADPLVLAATQEFPTPTWLASTSATGMDRYMGLALLASRILPNSVFGRSMLLTGSTEAKDYPAALLLATEEPDEYQIKIPKLLADKPIWIPTGKGKITGGKILKFQGGWAQVQAPEGSLTIKNRV